MRGEVRGQLSLRWEESLRTRGVPEEAEQQSRELLKQLLREVVEAERRKEVAKDEREDQPESS